MFGEFLSCIWQLYSVPLPFLFEGMTTGNFVIGVFVVVVSIKVLKHFLDDGD